MQSTAPKYRGKGCALLWWLSRGDRKLSGANLFLDHWRYQLVTNHRCIERCHRLLRLVICLSTSFVCLEWRSAGHRHSVRSAREDIFLRLVILGMIEQRCRRPNKMVRRPRPAVVGHGVRDLAPPTFLWGIDSLGRTRLARHGCIQARPNPRRGCAQRHGWPDASGGPPVIGRLPRPVSEGALEAKCAGVRAAPRPLASDCRP